MQRKNRDSHARRGDLASPHARRHLVRGVEAAQSWATDGHKWLNVPFDCGRSRPPHRSVIDAINATGEAFFSGGTWRGRRVMRISVCNWRTTEDDVARAIAATAAVLRASSPSRLI